MISTLTRRAIAMVPLIFATFARADESECLNFLEMQGTRVVGGVPGSEQDWPGFMRLENNGWPFCGATVIDDFWALTAAHCLKDPDDPEYPVKEILSQSLSVGRGAQSTDEASPYSIPIVAAYTHPLYQPNNVKLGNDIALLKLAFPANMYFATLYRPDDYADISTGTCLDVVGWGTMKAQTWWAEFDSPIPAMSSDPNIDELPAAERRQFKAAQVPMRDVAECGPVGTGHLGDLSKILCAGFEFGAIDACKGDSGGPIYYQTNQNIYQVGVVSWGEGCALPRLPGIYVNTSAYLDWINSIIDYGDNNQIPADTLAMLSIAEAQYWGLDEGDIFKASELFKQAIASSVTEAVEALKDICIFSDVYGLIFEEQCYQVLEASTPDSSVSASRIQDRADDTSGMGSVDECETKTSSFDSIVTSSVHVEEC